MDSKTEKNKKNKNKKLMDAAFKLFLEKGIKNTSVQEIVDACGIAKGTFYLYYKDKYELQNQLIANKSRELFNKALEQLYLKEITGIDNQIIFIIDYIIDEFINKPELINFISKNLSYGIYSDKITELIGDNDIGLYDHFLKSIQENNVKFKNPDVTLFMIIELVSSTCFTSILKNQPLPIMLYKPYLYKTISAMLISNQE